MRVMASTNRTAGYALVSLSDGVAQVHHPAEYMAALLTSSKARQGRTAVYLSECRTMGVRVLVLDVNLSESDFVARNGAIPFGLSAIRNCRKAAWSSLITEERRKNGSLHRSRTASTRVDIAVLNKRTIRVTHQGRSVRHHRCLAQGGSEREVR